MLPTNYCLNLAANYSHLSWSICNVQLKLFYSAGVVLMLKKRLCLVCVPWRLPDQHGPVELALDMCVARAAGVDEWVHSNQDKTLRVEFPHLNRQLSDRGQTKHGRHRHLWRGWRTGERGVRKNKMVKTKMWYITNKTGKNCREISGSE